MGSLTVLTEHLVKTCPSYATFMAVIVVTFLILGVPYFAFKLLGEKINKGRYIFEKRTNKDGYEYLYMLDTMTGNLKLIWDKRYTTMVEVDPGDI